MCSIRARVAHTSSNAVSRLPSLSEPQYNGTTSTPSLWAISQALTTVKSSVKNHALLALNRIFQASGTGCGEYEYAGGILS
ncbi:hypothetical protein KQL69_004534 [Escherichia coli]|nr:hypothetical protein [Escherichia coli]EHP9640903.1 hypothetical protein [Escherichia coli]EHP9646284.1 hypothetical protein [Escherichia coli]EHP9686436.1 hypothetical protein [Escherichia coli]EHP9691857.1 hypothetical protein [Escherichia coli]